MKCIACTHWQPRNAPKGMFAQGLAPCAIRSTSRAQTFAAGCERFSAAAEGTEAARLAFINRKNHAKTSG